MAHAQFACSDNVRYIGTCIMMTKLFIREGSPVLAPSMNIHVNYRLLTSWFREVNNLCVNDGIVVFVYGNTHVYMLTYKYISEIHV